MIKKRWLIPINGNEYEFFDWYSKEVESYESKVTQILEERGRKRHQIVEAGKLSSQPDVTILKDEIHDRLNDYQLVESDSCEVYIILDADESELAILKLSSLNIIDRRYGFRGRIKKAIERYEGYPIDEGYVL